MEHDPPSDSPPPRPRGLVALIVAHPVTTTMITIAAIVFGFVSLTRLPIELLPDLSYPAITVQTRFPDAAPVETEELVTRPIEERLGAVAGVVRMESTSREGTSEVVLEFAWGTRIDGALADVREKLDRVGLPPTASRPLVLRYDPSSEPIMRLGLRWRPGTSAEIESSALRRLTERTLQRELEKISGVAAVELHGGDEDEVRVELDPDRLAAHGIEASEVVRAIERNNVNRPGGAINEQNSRYLVRTLHEARTPEELGATIVRTSGNAELRLRDIARVMRTPIEREEITFVDGHEAIELAVFPEGDANVVAVAESIRRAMTRLSPPRGYELVVLSDRAEFIESAISEVRDNLLLGSAIAVAVLLFFLRDLRATAIIGVAIPISLMVSFLPLQMLGVSLNVMSLGGLALGTGMLVDNSIVVLESIAKRPEAGGPGSRVVAVVAGTTEVAPSVLASTFTTIAVFGPMAFVEGVAGELVRDLSYAVSFSMLSSLIVSLSLVPVLSALPLPHDRDSTEPAPRSILAALVVWPIAVVVGLLRGVTIALGVGSERLVRPATRVYEACERVYPAALSAALSVRTWIVSAAMVGTVVGGWRWSQGETTLIPPLDQREFYVQITLPRGASLERTAEVVRALDASIATAPEVESRFARAGSVSVAGSATGETRAAYLGQLNLRLADSVGDRTRAAAELFERMRTAIPMPGISLGLGYPTLVSFDPPIEIRGYSDDLEHAAEHMSAVASDLQRLDGLVDVVADDPHGRPEVRVHFDRERLGRLGIGAEQAALAVQRSIQGEIATTMFTDDDQLDVRVSLPAADRSRPEDVSAIQVGVAQGVPIRLDAVARVEGARGPAEIRRIDGRRALRIRARSASLDLGGIARRAEAALRAHDDPQVELEIRGQAGLIENSRVGLAVTAALSTFLVYVVMASSFESLLHPLLILSTVPTSIVGALGACHVAGIPNSAVVGIGVIVLAGIAVNNAIVLINGVNDRRGAGADVREALLAAGSSRLRPIVMTTLTTLGALAPMAWGWGDGAALRQPLAVAILGGLTIATGVTLVLIPCAYSLLPGRVRAAWVHRDDEDA